MQLKSVTSLGELSVLIKNVSVVDGSGKPPYKAGICTGSDKRQAHRSVPGYRDQEV